MSTSIDDLKNQLVPSSHRGGGALTVATNVESDRAVAMIQGQMTLAKKFPRNQGESLTNILEQCQLIPVAEDAHYSFRRGGSVIEGPSINLLKIIATNWRNIIFNVRELERRQGESTAVVYAIDLETNVMAQREFIVRHVRDKNDDDGNASGVQLKSERDIYETIANMGSRRLRACLEDIIPPHIIGAASRACYATLKAAAEKEPLADRLKKLLPAFEAIGVSKPMLVKYLGGRAVDEMLEKEYIQLRNIYRSINTGAARVEEFFEKPNVADSVAAGKGGGSKTQQAAAGGQQAQPPKQDERPAGAPPAEDPPKGPPTSDELIAQIKGLKTVAEVNAIGAVIKANQKNWTPEQTKAVKKAASDRVDFLNAKAEEAAERAGMADESGGAPE